MKKVLKDWRVWVSVLLLATIAWAVASGQGKEILVGVQKARDFEWGTLLIALSLCSLQVILMGLRTWTLCPSGTPVIPVLWAITFGQFANAFFPARAGDALKIAILGDKEKGAKMPVITATGVFLADKVLDLLGIFSWIFLSQSYRIKALKPDMPWLKPSLFLWIVVAHLAFYVLWRKVIRHKLPGLEKRLRELGNGLKSLLLWRHSFPALVFSILTWGAEASALFFLLKGMGYDFPFNYAVATLVVLNLAISIPISVANLGTFEASVVFALTRLGVASAPAIAIAVVHHLMQLFGTATATLLCRLLRLLPKKL